MTVHRPEPVFLPIHDARSEQDDPGSGRSALRSRRAVAACALLAVVGWSVQPLQAQARRAGWARSPGPARVVGTAPRTGDPAAALSSGRADALALAGRSRLAEDDLLGAQRVFRRLRQAIPDHLEGALGLGQVYLRLGRPGLALRYARAARAQDARDPRGAALEIQALCRARRFDLAVTVAEDAMATFATDPGVELVAAYASSLFRVQRIDQAASAYRRVLELDPGHAEAHLRLGSGLHAPVQLRLGADEVLRLGVAAFQRSDLDGAVRLYSERLAARSDHPVAHRLMGEALLMREAQASVALRAPAFQRLTEVLVVPTVDQTALRRFVRGYDELSEGRKAVVVRAVAPFAGLLPRLLTMGGHHDLLGELERTTDHPTRSRLRGSRTFDGRVWDDVRGIGGLRAATGIEALDEAMVFGFDTLAHEVAHQAHLFGFRRVDRLRVRDLYQRARAENRFLDYYAASNEAEYFGQGVEAFVSYGKRPGREPTHGHTRFELYRRDPALHDFIARIVDHDPLRDPRQRRLVLQAAFDVALVSGRPEDALVAARMLPPGEVRTQRVIEGLRAVRLARSY